MGKVTCFYLSLTFFAYCSGIIFTINRINDDLISKPLSLSYIIIDAIASFYIIYRLFNTKKIHCLTICTKFLIAIWNIAFFFVIAFTLTKYTKVENIKILSQNQLRPFLFYELIVVLKLYLHIISLIRIDQSKCIENSKNRNKDDYWQEIKIEDSNEEEFYNEERLKEKEKENRNLKMENNILKKEKIKADNNSIRNKKIEILIDFIKSKYNINISKDLLYKKLLLEIKDKCELIINKKKYEEIIINYIKENVFKFLKCPLSKNYFNNPYITPEGQTF